jgi:hypothetical protein
MESPKEFCDAFSFSGNARNSQILLRDETLPSEYPPDTNIYTLETFPNDVCDGNRTDDSRTSSKDHSKGVSSLENNTLNFSHLLRFLFPKRRSVFLGKSETERWSNTLFLFDCCQLSKDMGTVIYLNSRELFLCQGNLNILLFQAAENHCYQIMNLLVSNGAQMTLAVLRNMFDADSETFLKFLEQREPQLDQFELRALAVQDYRRGNTEKALEKLQMFGASPDLMSRLNSEEQAFVRMFL